jgi:hypothetical protein
MTQSGIDAKLAELRAVFDESFAHPAVLPEDAGERLLTIRIGAEGYALRLGEISGIQALRRVVPLPGGPEGFRGLAGIRGRLVAVYSLAALLGIRGAGEENWLVMTQGPEPIGLSFPAFEGFLDESALYPAQERETEHVREVLRAGSVVRGVIHLPSVADAIMRRTRP